MIRRTLALLLPALLPVLCGGVLLAAPSRAADSFGPEQRDEIGRVVRDYLIKNPDVIQEAIAELERRQNEAQKTAQMAALNETREALLNSPGGNVVGNPAGDVTLVEFFDYNCGYCKQAVADLKTLVKSDPKLRIVLRDLTIIGGPSSEEASRVALAVKQQISGEKLFDYHVRLIETRGRINGERALAVAREVGLDMTRLQKDMASGAAAAIIGENSGLAQKLGINGTPAFIIGDEVVSGAIGLGPLRQAVAAVRECGRAAC